MNRYQRHSTVTFALFAVGFLVMFIGAMFDQVAVEVTGGAIATAGAIVFVRVAFHYNQYAARRGEER
jgi:uncharacterized membrane protein YjjP (DUF1212 family)